MNMRVPFLLVIVACTCINRPLHAESNWTKLFDGQTLEGWIQKNGTATYHVDDNSIVGTTNEGSPNSFLCTEKEYGDFELTFEVRVDDRLNSGVQIRSKTKPVGADSSETFGRVYGPQVEIESSAEEGAKAGYVYGEATGRGWLTKEAHLKPHPYFRNGQWNRFRVVAQGTRIQTFINDKPVEDLTDEPIYQSHPKGFIGLQVHGIASGTGPFKVAWRDIRIRELSQ